MSTNVVTGVTVGVYVAEAFVPFISSRTTVTPVTTFVDKEGKAIPGYPTEDGENPKKDIPGYRFVETKKLPNGDTVHVYEKIIPSVKPEPAKPSTPAPAKPAKELPNTGTEDHSSLAALGLLGVLSGFGLVARKKKED